MKVSKFKFNLYIYIYIYIFTFDVLWIYYAEHIPDNGLASPGACLVC